MRMLPTEQSQVGQRRIVSMRAVELFAVFFLFIIGWLFLYRHSSGPANWLDDLKYMHLALNPEPEPRQVHRFFHIYFQKLFYAMAGHPLAGANLLWSFAVAGTAASTYACARFFTAHTTPLHGLIALLFFCAHPLILPFTGASSVDYTLPLPVTAFLLAYLLSFRFERYRIPLLIAMGFLFGCAFKSKECSAVLAILFAGLAYTGEGRFSFEKLAKGLAAALLGIVLFQLLLVLLDHIYLGDALFSLRLSSWKTQVNHVAANALGKFSHTGDNWYAYLLSSSVILSVVPFLLYLINIAKGGETDFLPHQRIVWLLPVAFITFFTLTAIKATWISTILARYHLPIIPIVAILAAQFFEAIPNVTHRTCESRLRKVLPRAASWPESALFRGLFLMACATAAAWLFYCSSNFLAEKFEWKGADLRKFYSTVSYPIAGSLLIMLAGGLKHKWRFSQLALALACVCFLCIPPMAQYTNAMMKGIDNIPVKKAANIVGQNGASVRRARTFAPLKASAQYITDTKDVKLFVSQSIYVDHGVFARNRKYAAILFNLFFEAKLSETDAAYWYVKSRERLVDLLVGEEYAYAYLTQQDWSSLPGGVRAKLLSSYEYHELALFENVKIAFLRNLKYAAAPADSQGSQQPPQVMIKE